MKTVPNNSVREKDKKEDNGFPYAAVIMLGILVVGGILMVLKIIGII
jgi:hypothetical protein